MIRITTQAGEAGRVVVTIDGCLSDEDVEQVRAFRKKAGQGVCLNLRGLDICLPAGIRVVKAWLAAGALLKESTPFHRLLVQGPAAREWGRPSNRTRDRKGNDA